MLRCSRFASRQCSSVLWCLVCYSLPAGSLLCKQISLGLKHVRYMAVRSELPHDFGYACLPGCMQEVSGPMMYGHSSPLNLSTAQLTSDAFKISAMDHGPSTPIGHSSPLEHACVPIRSSCCVHGISWLARNDFHGIQFDDVVHLLTYHICKHIVSTLEIELTPFRIVICTQRSKPCTLSQMTAASHEQTCCAGSMLHRLDPRICFVLQGDM